MMFPISLVLSFTLVLFGIGVAFALVGRSSRIGARRGSGVNEYLRLPAEPRDPLEIVRERYAKGEIDHDQLDRYLRNLLKPSGFDQPGGDAV